MTGRRLSIEALPRGVKKLIKFLIPNSLLIKRESKKKNNFIEQTNKEIFSKIYAEYLWGRASGSLAFYSGDGSHDPLIIDSYIENVIIFLKSLNEPKVIVDLGCGDFNVGKNFANYAKQIIACDVVPNVIDNNRKKFKITNCNFEVLDAVKDEIPCGDIVIIRQVLQHLSNDDITIILRKLEQSTSYIIFTDHQPIGIDWQKNIDKNSGPDIRVQFNSGLDLLADPFNLRVKSFKEIDSAILGNECIKTIVYELDIM